MTMMSHRRASAVRRTVLALALFAVTTPSRRARAHKNGFAALGCEGCHQNGRPATVTLTAAPQAPAAGEAVTLTVSVSQTNGAVAGFYLTTDFGSGTFDTAANGTTLLSGGIGHSTPRTGSGGQTTFEARWSSATVGGVVFHVYGLSANGDGTNRGDGAGEATLALAVGCAGARYFIDQDADGYGTSDPAYRSLLDCARPRGYADNARDCDDFHDVVHPGHAEVCDGKDNDCSGGVDDGDSVVLCLTTGQACVQGRCVASNGSGGVTGGVGSGGSGGRAAGSGGVTGAAGRAGGPAGPAGADASNDPKGDDGGPRGEAPPSTAPGCSVGATVSSSPARPPVAPPLALLASLFCALRRTSTRRTDERGHAHQARHAR